MLGIATILMLRVYQVTLSKWIGPCCRYYPSCSDYCVEAISCHGVLRGSWLGVKRVCRCHPWGDGGVDLVPEAKSIS